MANTEGIPDDDLFNLLSFKDEENTQCKKSIPSVTRKKPNLASERRHQLIADFDYNEKPAAKVIRFSSKPNDTITDVASSPRKRTRGKPIISKYVDSGHKIHANNYEYDVMSDGSDSEQILDGNANTIPSNPNQDDMNQNSTIDNHTSHTPPIILSDSITEKPISKAILTNHHQIQHNNVNTSTTKLSKFKMKQSQHQRQHSDKNDKDNNITSKHIITAGGFPSFDFPIGSFVQRKEIKTVHKNKNIDIGDSGDSDGVTSLKESCLTSSVTPKTSLHTEDSNDKIMGMDENNKTFIANMTKEEIEQGLLEIENILSPKSIEYLKNRKRNTKLQGNHSKDKNNIDTQKIDENESPHADKSYTTTTESSSLEKKMAMATLLSNIVTEDDLDDAFQKGLDLHGIPETPFNNSINNDEIELQQQQSSLSLESCTKLLRSTSHRQRILAAKQVCNILEARVSELLMVGESTISDRNDNEINQYPDSLPVALRCLLDVTSPRKNILLLSYVIRAIYLLIILFVHPEHRVLFPYSTDFEYGKMNLVSIYQLYFMYDEIPTTPIRSCYTSSYPTKLNSSSSNIDDNLSQGCYSTGSTTESATKDGEAFYMDPLWTLLSRMKIVPCIDHLLHSFHQSEQNDVLLPYESIKYVCAMLTMLSLRSPGAACAISQHQSLLKNLISMTIDPTNNDEFIKLKSSSIETNRDGNFIVNTKVALPAIIMLCTISRQSRTAAFSILTSAIDNIISILALPAENEEEMKTQQWSIILWRIFLRYGFGFRYLSVFLPLSVSHLTITNRNKFSLVVEYLTAYSTFCDCVKTYATLRGLSENNPQLEVTLNSEDEDTILKGGVWLSSHVLECVLYFTNAEFSTTLDSAPDLKCASARLRLLLSYAIASGPIDMPQDGTSYDSTTFKSAHLSPVVTNSTCLSTLEAIVRNGIFYNALEMCLKYSCNLSLNEIDGNKYFEEATACSFIKSFFDILHNLLVLPTRIISYEEIANEEEYETKLALVAKHVFAITINLLQTSPSCKEVHTNHQNMVHLPSRKGWLNKSHFSIAKFLASTATLWSSTLPDKASVMSMIQSFFFSLLGRLQCGDEAMAAILLSQDIVFGSNTDSTPIQNVLIRELCTGTHSQLQLDHSFKLMGGPGLSFNGKGQFALESLRVDADFRISNENSDQYSGDILPMDSDWLWRLLSGNCNLDSSKDPQEQMKIIDETCQVVFQTLKSLITAEQSSDSHYVKSVNIGTKMYHLINVCLYPEDVLRQDEFQPLFNNIFKSYHETFVSEKGEAVQSFLNSSFKYSSRNKLSNKLSSSQKYTKDENDMKTLLKDEITKEERALDDLVTDLCAFFLEYGAQYDCFIQCIRVFLNPCFPITTRIGILTKINDVAYLLTTEAELDDKSGSLLVYPLENCLSGLPWKDDSKRDSALFLDLLATMLKGTKGSQRKLDRNNFVYLYAVGNLARSLASSSRRCECGIEAMKNRMRGMDASITCDIVSCAQYLLKSKDGISHDLVLGLIDICFKNFHVTNILSAWDIDDTLWDKMVEMLLCSYE